MSQSNIKVEAGQVYTLKPNKKGSFGEETLTIKSIEMLSHGLYFTCEENEGTWSVHLLEDRYNLVVNKNLSKFTLTFTEAMEVLKQDSGWVQGEDFHKSVVFLNHKGIFKMRDFLFFRGCYPEEVSISVGMMNQKYRVVQFQSELEK